MRKLPLLIWGVCSSSLLAVLVVGAISYCDEGALFWGEYRHGLGTVLSSAVESCRSNKFPRQPRIVYEYKVEGIRYTSDRFNTKYGCMSEKDARFFVSKLAPGASISVFYNPQKPAFAILRKDGLSSASVGGLLISFFLGLSVWRLIVASRAS